MLELYHNGVRIIPEPRIFIDAAPGAWEAPAIIMSRVNGISLKELLGGIEKSQCLRLGKS